MSVLAIQLKVKGGFLREFNYQHHSPKTLQMRGYLHPLAAVVIVEAALTCLTEIRWTIVQGSNFPLPFSLTKYRRPGI